jgi:hypothetical protein
MKFRKISLQSLLKQTKDTKKIKENVLNTFNGRGKSEVSDFLHNKSIDYEQRSLSSTYLIYNDRSQLVGYFTISNKGLIISKENYEKLLKTQQKKLSFNGRKLENGDYIVNSFLLGQLGKNFNKNISEEDKIKGVELLTIAYNHLIEIKNLINVKYLWIECEDNKKLLDFYSNFGFKLIENYVSNNGLKVMILKLEN